MLILIIGIKLYFFPSFSPEVFEKNSSKEVHIPRGSTLNEISQILFENQVLSNKTLFVLLGKISGKQHQIKAGLLKIPEGLHPWHLLNYLINPESVRLKVTIPEGIRAAEIASILRQSDDIDSTYFMQLVTDSNFCKELGVEATSLEGYLQPETYYLTVGMDEKEIIRLLVENTLSIFSEDSVRRQMENLNMSIHQVLTLASIIEGEVLVDSERVLVSSVYHNRLKRGWRLQADPTIQYILRGKPRRLLHKHLEINSPYNTYLYKGLPPGPINNPGRRSILAALFPAETDYMYFVANGKGGHYFSRTAKEHARWKAKFDQIRREVRRNRKKY
ncbi:MAG: endolytic transglycosylase MltG [Calditrichia bacterium]